MIVGVVDYDYLIILPIDADDESVEEAADMLVNAIRHNWMQEHGPEIL